MLPVAVLAGGGLLAAGCGGTNAAAVAELRSNVPRAAVPAGSVAAARAAAGEQELTTALLRQVVNGAPGENVAISPSSISTALSMLELGARGPTASEIAGALRTENTTAAEQAAGWNALDRELGDAARRAGIDLSTANGVWLDEQFAVHRSFLDALARNFGAGVRRVDFRGAPDGARMAINRWVAGNTHGKIEDLFPPGSIDSGTAAALVNAAYFKAKWQQAFRSDGTQRGVFHAPAGDKSVEFMNETVSAAVTSGDVDAVQLPYSGGRFAATIVMPVSTDLRSYVMGLDGQRLARLFGQLATGQVEVALPKFEVKRPTTLNPHLQALGMRLAFTDRADFSALSSSPLTVSTVQHQAYVKVDEQGTEAAAGTGVGLVVTASPAQPLKVRFDRPFLFFVRDTGTGTILYAVAVNDPSLRS